MKQLVNNSKVTITITITNVANFQLSSIVSLYININCFLITVNPQEPTLSLVPVITQKSTFAMCVIENFYPKNLIVQWKVNDEYSQKQTKLESKRNAEGLFTAHSFYEVSSKTWNVNTRYTCEVTHQGKLIPVTKNFKGKSFNVGFLLLTPFSSPFCSNSHKDALLQIVPIHRHSLHMIPNLH